VITVAGIGGGHGGGKEVLPNTGTVCVETVADPGEAGMGLFLIFTHRKTMKV
jgi:hypothetical protein